MVDVSVEVVINKPIGKVAAFAINPDNATSWYVNIKSSRKLTEGPISVGSEIAFVAHFLGRKLEYTYEVVTLEYNKKFVMKTAQGPFPMETSYLFEEIEENKTKMILRNTGDPKGFSKVFAPLMRKMMKKANQNDLKLIKSILEKEE